MTGEQGKAGEWIETAVLLAAVNCPHSIKEKRIVLAFDALKPGHNALNQLSGRIAQALTQREEAFAAVVKALSAMLTQMGMDEDEWNKPTFDQARAALAQAERPKYGAAREHVSSADCWCEPEIDYVDPETGATVYIHRDLQ